MVFEFADTVSEAVGHYLVIDSMESTTVDDIHVYGARTGTSTAGHSINTGELRIFG